MMNEDLIKGLIGLKLKLAESLVAQLPENQAIEVRKLGKVILDALNEHASSPSQREKTASKNTVEEIIIE